ncbi:MAG TPA: hypothetical protein VM182_00520 [Terriglobia bacterium]|nr:hypothetical protein [Terriglobia bacterium]
MPKKLFAGRMWGPVLFGLVMTCLLILSSQPLAVAKKNKEKIKERLRSLQVVHVVGEGPVARYVKQNIEQKTCLREPEENEGAEAILTVWQEIRPCQLGLSGVCLSVNAKLTDAQTNEVLWFRTDDQFGSRMSIGVDEAGGKWVLWNLASTCCKKR